MFKNFREEAIQKIAWRLVRSAEDRFKAAAGDVKLTWAIDQLVSEVRSLKRSRAEDYIRSAYVQFSMEQKAYHGF